VEQNAAVHILVTEDGWQMNNEDISTIEELLNKLNDL